MSYKTDVQVAVVTAAYPLYRALCEANTKLSR
jgi:hypothetical protein